MAIVRDNSVVNALRGKFGKTFVFRQVGGVTIASKRARPPKHQSALQRQNRERFKEATYYAKAMMLNPEKKAYYTRKARKLGLTNAYTAAITDYMRKPQIVNAEAKRNENKNSTCVKIKTEKKGFRVSEVKITVLSAKREVLEEGCATDRNNTQDWMYHLKHTYSGNDEPTTILISALDRTGNVASKEIVFG